MPVRPPEIQDIEQFQRDMELGIIKVRKNGVVVRNPSSKEFWKSFERKVAKDFGTTRTPLSGMVKTITNSDTLHPKIYVECKARGGDKMKFYEDYTSKITKNRYEYYSIENKTNGELIYLFTSEIFFKFLANRTINLKMLNCVAENRTYKSVLSLYRQTVDRAEIEGKLPIVALKKKNTKGYLIGIHPRDFEELHNILNTGKWKTTQ